MKSNRPFFAFSLLALALAAPLSAGVEVRLQLPQRARLDLQGRKSLAVAPFVVVSQEGEGRLKGKNIDIQKEFARYLLKVLRRETSLKIVETGPVEMPIYDLNQLARQTDFWRALGERLQADLILTGGLDFDIQDRSGYKTEEYVSPFNGRTYYRQSLVEQTGFQYDILMQVYDAKTGALLYQDNFKDFQKFEGSDVDPLAGMFENLLSLEGRIVNVFTQKEVEATRVLLTD
jgi:TolB-like protein